MTYDTMSSLANDIIDGDVTELAKLFLSVSANMPPLCDNNISALFQDEIPSNIISLEDVEERLCKVKLKDLCIY